MDVLNKEVAKLTIEEKTLNIEKLKSEINKGVVKPDTITSTVQNFDYDLKVVTRRSNFYRELLDYEKVTAIGFTAIPDPSVKPIEKSIIQRNDFSKFILSTDKLPVNVIEDATIEIIAPVLNDGTYLWKGLYNGRPISFSMLDEVFKNDVLRGNVSFAHGSTIHCVMNINRRLNEVGEVIVTKYSVPTVLTWSDGIVSEETAQGNIYRRKQRLAADQYNLFVQTERH